MISRSTMAGKVFGATAAALFPMVQEESAFNDLTAATLTPGTVRQDVCGKTIGIPPVSLEIAGWFRSKMPIPGTDAYISFRRQPSMTLHIGDAAHIDDWGVRIPLCDMSAERVQSLVVGQYLRLAERSRRQRLSPSERVYWKAMVSDSDYADFCQRTAPMTMLSGIRVRSYKDTVEVLWNGSDPETLCGNFAQQLIVVEDGEEFSARGRFVDDALSALSDVVPLGKPASVDINDLFSKV